jgi:glycosyltransferase involved in cell wall biosynthesis
METPTANMVSVITCFLNVEKYIEEAIVSVLHQTYDNWELLLVDDGSSDKSTSIAKQYAALYPDKIIYIEHPGHINKGLSASRNEGIKNAAGNIIAFLDADDVWRPDYLAHQVSILKQFPVAMVCEATEYWFSWDASQKKDIIIPVGTNGNCLYTPPQLILSLYPLGAGAAPCVCGILVKKDLLLKHGSFDESFTGMYEDQVFLSKFYVNEPIYISTLCNNRYRQRPGSLMATSQDTYHQIRLRFLIWLESYLQIQKVKNPEVNRLLKKALWPYRHPTLHYVIDSVTHRIRPGIRKLLSAPIKQMSKYW